MIDFHSHILPKVDDGSKSVELSLQMLDASLRQGITHMVATPHFYANRMDPQQFLENRQRAYEALLKQGPPAPQLLLGAEVTYYRDMGHSEAIRCFRIESTELVLVEMPFTPWSERMLEDLKLLRDHQGLTPVLAHVDRYRGREQFPKYAEQLRDEGILCQCNAEAFDGFFSGRWALRQLRKGTVQLLGSDCHNMGRRPPNLSRALQIIGHKLGDRTVAELTDFSAQILKLETR